MPDEATSIPTEPTTDRKRASKARHAFCDALHDSATCVGLGSTRLREIVESKLMKLGFTSDEAAPLWRELRREGVVSFSDDQLDDVQLVQPRAREFLFGFAEAIAE